MNKKFIFIIIIIIILLILLLKKQENFKNEPEEQKFNPSNVTQELDPLYKDQVVYNEDPHDGIYNYEQCRMKCDGNCVPFGLMPQVHCFLRK